jgi:uncharacterized membrane protein YeaQ/YmgE (transglycosylase-associated protein family)
MHVAMPFSSYFGPMSGLEELLLVLSVIVAFFIAGFIVDAVMKKDGFGPYWSGGLSLVGIMIGLTIRSTFFPFRASHEPYLTLAVVFATLLVLLLAISVFRNKFA